MKMKQEITSRAPLGGEDPDTLRGEVEERGSDSSAGHLVLGSSAHVGPVGERSKANRTVGGSGVVVRGVYKVLTIVWDVSEVLEGDVAGGWVSQRSCWCQ